MRPPSQFGCVAGTEGRRGPLRSGEATYGGGKRRRGNIRRRQEAARQEERRPAEEQDRRKAPWAMRPPSQFGCVAGTEGRRGPLRSGEATYGGGKRRRGNIRRRQEAARQEERRPAEEQDRRKAPWAMRPPSQFGCVAGTEGRRGPLRSGEATYGGGKRRRGNIRRRQEAARQEERRPAEEQDRRKAPWAMRPPSQFGCVAGTEGRRGPLRSGEATYGGGKRRRGKRSGVRLKSRTGERRPGQ
ncbi:uncharacterized protein [Melanerpes formicivorus]|uniref:uncharacterized protein n=1 Tax=Melanerpes formicivorus TaxID=211600 RepID=UPI00358ED148